jgi:hypothetical protein
LIGARLVGPTALAPFLYFSNNSPSIHDLPRPTFHGKIHVIKPAYKAIKTYYQTLQTYRDERVEHEGATETAFQQLIADTARSHGLTLLPKLKLQVKGKNIAIGAGLLTPLGDRRGSPDPVATSRKSPRATRFRTPCSKTHARPSSTKTAWSATSST